MKLRNYLLLAIFALIAFTYIGCELIFPDDDEDVPTLTEAQKDAIVQAHQNVSATVDDLLLDENPLTAFENNVNTIKAMENVEEKPKLCRKNAEEVTLETIGAVLDRAGMERFLQRTQVFQERLAENDCDQLLYEGMMEALGYSKNKGPFLQLARKTPLNILIGQPPEKIQALLFGIAGLLPSQNGKKLTFDCG